MKFICVTIVLVLCANTLAKQGRIVGGTDAIPHSAPYLVSIQWAIIPSVRTTHYCGGTLITFSRALTAAHCIQTTGIMRAVAGLHKLDEDQAEHQTRDIIEAIPHELYASGPNNYDIAILRVNEPFISHPFVQIVGLPPAIATHFGRATVYGWGSVSNTTTAGNHILSNTLQTLDKDILHSVVCRVYLDGIVTISDNNICTGPTQSNVDVCGGDLGGPLVQFNNNRFELIGIISWGPSPCGSGPSVHIRVSMFVNWIIDKLLEQNIYYC